MAVMSSEYLYLLFDMPLYGGTYDIGNYHVTPWVNSGPVAFPMVANYQCAGPFAGIGGIYDPGGASSLRSLMSNKSAWSVEMFFYLNSLATNQCWFGYTNQGVAEETLAILTDGSVAAFHGPPPPSGAYAQTPPSAITTGVWTKLKYEVTPDTIGHIYVNDIELASGTPGSATHLWTLISMTTGYQTLFGLYLDGYIRNVKLTCQQVLAP